MTLVTPELLPRIGRDPDLFRNSLGDCLARWMLEPAERSRLGLDPPKHPGDSGSAVVLCVFREGQGPSLCAPGFGIPVRWEPEMPERPGHDARLPRGLRALADRVIDAWRRRGSLGPTRWRLALHPDVGTSVDLSQLPGEWDSGAAPLLASLRVAAAGGATGDTTYSTGCLDDRDRLYGVDGLAAKIDVVLRVRNSAACTLFVPAESHRAAEARAAGLEVQPYQVGASMDQQLIEHLKRLEVAPDPERDLDVKLAYYNRTWMRPEDLKEFYRKSLLFELGVQVRSQPDFDAIAGGVETLVLVLSLRGALAELLIRTIRPAKVVLLQTKEAKERSGFTRENVEDVTPDVCCVDLEQRDFNAADRSRLAEVLAPHGARALVDVTSAGGSAAVPLVLAARASGARITYLENRQEGDRPIAGGERLIRLHWAEAPREA